MAAKGPDTIALVFYAGHGLQIDGENYLVPVDIDPKREADIPVLTLSNTQGFARLSRTWPASGGRTLIRFAAGFSNC